MNKEEMNVDIMSSEELEDFEYLIQNYSKSKLAYKIIKIEEECKSYYNANFESQQENEQLKILVELLYFNVELNDEQIELLNKILEIGDSNE